MANKHNNETHKEIVHAPHDKRSEENGRELSAMGDAKIIRQRMLVRQRMLDWKATSYKIEVADEASVVPPDFIPVQEGPSPDVIADFVRLAGSFTIEDGTSYIDATHPLNSTVRNALVLAQGMANAPRWAADYVCGLLKKGAIRTAKITEKTHGALEGDTLEQQLVGPAKDVNHNLETIISMQLRGFFFFFFFRISELTTMRKDQVIAVLWHPRRIRQHQLRLLRTITPALSPRNTFLDQSGAPSPTTAFANPCPRLPPTPRSAPPTSHLLEPTARPQPSAPPTSPNQLPARRYLRNARPSLV